MKERPLVKSLALEQSADAALGVLSHFRVQFYDCLYTRADALFELTDAVLCSDGPVTSLVELTLTAEHRRGHGAMYDAVNHGWLEPRRLRRLLASTPLPRAADGRIVLAVDVSNWLRPDAPTSPGLLFCHVYGRGRSVDQFIPGWPYSFVAALETGRTSWTAVLDAIRLGPADDATEVTAAQLREVVTRLVHAGQWRPGDADILVVMDTGYDVTRLTYVLADLPVELVGRLRSTASCSGTPAHAAPPHAVDSPASTAASSPSPSRSPGTPLTRPRRATPPATAGPKPSPGTGCTPDCRPVAPGSTTAVNSL